MADNQEGFNFSTLVTAIHQVDENMAAQAGRADYGDKLFSELAKRLTGINVSNCNRRQLYRYLRFYRLYPQIVGTLSAQLKTMLPAGLHGIEKVGTPSPQLKVPPEKHDGRRRQAARGHSALHAKRPCPGGIRPGRYGQPPVRLQVPARTAPQGRNTEISGREDAGGGGMTRADTLYVQFIEAIIKRNLEVLGYGE